MNQHIYWDYFKIKHWLSKCAEGDFSRHLHVHISVPYKQIKPFYTASTELVEIPDCCVYLVLTCRNQIYARTGALSGENKKEKEKKKTTPKTNPSILRTKPTVSPNRVNTTWISKSTALHFSSAIVNEGRGSAQRNSCQLRSAPGELLWAHRRLLGLWEPQLLEVFPQHLGTSSIRTALLGASKHCLGGFLQRKKEEKNAHCACMFTQGNKSACLQAHMGPNALKSMEIHCDWQWAPGMPSKKSKGLGGARAEMLSGASMGQVVTWPDGALSLRCW